MIFSSWNDLIRVVIVGVSAYVALIVLLRISGKRTLSKLNAFDLVVTVALGSTLATVLLSKDVALVEGIVALALLIFLQFIIAWTSVRSASFRRLVKSEPTMLFYDGEFLPGVMQSERMTQEEVLAAVRAQGISSLQGVQAVVLETDGSLTVLESGSDGTASALKSVQNAPSVVST